MTSPELAQVVHSLTTARADDLQFHDAYPGCVPFVEEWPGIARILLDLRCDWPAIVELAAMTGESPPGAAEAVARLAHQTEPAKDPLPQLDFWDTVCGSIARSRRLGMIADADALARMNALWRQTSRLDTAQRQGLRIFTMGMGLFVESDHRDVANDTAKLLTIADGLIPADSVTGELCEAVWTAVY